MGNVGYWSSRGNVFVRKISVNAMQIGCRWSENIGVVKIFLSFCGKCVDLCDFF